MVYLTVSDIMKILGIKQSLAYKIMRNLNKQLEAKGYIVVAGKTPIKFFCEHYYADTDQILAQLGR